MHLVADLRYAWRTLRAAPIFTIVAALSIALGIGANTAIFTLVDQVLLRLLPVKEPQRLVLLQGPQIGHYGSNYGQNALSYPMFRDFEDHHDVFDGMFARYGLPLQVGFDGQTERIRGELVSGGYFPVLGVGAALGRVIGRDDDRVPGGHPVVVLTYGYWRSRFGGDPSVLGRQLIVNSHSLTVIGVTEEGFTGLDIGDTTQMFVPTMMKAQMTPSWNALDNRRLRWVNTFGRLERGVSLEQAQARLRPFFHTMLSMEVREPAFARASADSRARFLAGELTLQPGSQGRPGLRGALTKPLWVLMALVGGVLLIACANVANLLIARAAARQREIAIRLAIGASRARVVQQLLVESLLIAVAGGAAGLVLALVALKPMLALLVSADQDVAISTTLDVRLFLFAFAVTGLTGVLFGLVPALQGTRPQLAPTLKDQAGSVAGGGGLRLRRALVTAQVSPGFFTTLGIPLIAGRDFTDLDARATAARPGEEESRVAIVDERFAKKYFPDGQAVGRHIGLGNDPGTPTPIEIIGVVKDAKFRALREAPPYQVFFAYYESGGGQAITYLETHGDPEAMFKTVRQIVHDLDPNLPVFGARTLDRALRGTLRNERLLANLSAVFGLLATLLAMIGLYGVLAFTVSRRTREIGIRMALGALRSHVSWLVLRELLILAGAGIALALPAAWWLSRLVISQLYNVAPMDPVTIIAAITALGTVTLCAGLIPTLRATRINPVRALRQD